jgi:hypothetical protein
MEYDDGTIVQAGKQPSPNHVWDGQSNVWRDWRNLDKKKADKWTEIKAKRDEHEKKFKWDYVLFDSDLVSQSRVQGAVAQAQLQGDAFSIVWTLADNTVRTLSATDMIAVGACMGEHITAVHANARARRDEINKATTAEEIEAIVW